MKTLSPTFRLAFLFVLFSGIFLNACDDVADTLAAPKCLEYMAGKWIRIESNNSNNDCIQLVLSTKEGIVLENPREALGVDPGDVLWKDITHKEGSESEFTVNILGSDGLYYSGKMTVVNESEIEVTVDISASGDSQKWIRLREYTDISSCLNANLEGSWTRTQSNNTPLDGMRLRVSDTQGMVTFLPATANNYSIDDILWDEIMPIDQDNFELKVLGSDGLYYDASISMENANKLTLSIGSSGSGNEQTWER